MRKKLLCLSMLLSLLFGCVPPQQLENLGIIYAGGIDRTDDGKLQLTAVINQFEPQSKNLTKIVSGEANTLKGASENANLETNFRLATGKLAIDIFGRETAEQGLSAYIDALARDSNIPNTVYLAVSQTTAKELLTIQNKAISVNSGQFLHDVIEKNSRDDLFPVMTLFKFQSRMFDVGRDPILPMFELKGDIPKMTGIALFKDDRYVGKISMNDKYMINLLEKKIKEERFEMALPAKALKKVRRGSMNEDKKYIDMVFEIVKGNGDIDIANMDKLQFTTDINMDVTLLESTEELDFKNKKALRAVEKEIQKLLAAKYERMLTHLKKLNVDILGYGDVYRAHKKGSKLTKSEWRRLYPDIKVKFNIDVNLLGHGELS